MPFADQDLSLDLGRMTPQRLKGLMGGVAMLYASADRSRFIGALQGFLASILPFDHLTIFSQEEDTRPRLIWTSFDSAVIRTGVRNYLMSTYVVDPFVMAFRGGAPSGAYRGCDMANRAAVLRSEWNGLPLEVTRGEDLGYRTADWPRHLSELQIVFGTESQDGRKTCCQIGLYRNPEGHCFSEGERRLLTAFTPAIAGAFGQACHSALDRHAAIPEYLDLLSPREREVIQLVAKGFGSPAISELLSVSLETVKTHRKRAYRKLAISSQAELFALMQSQSTHLSSDRPV